MGRCKSLAPWRRSSAVRLSSLGPGSCVSTSWVAQGSPWAAAVVCWLLDGRYSFLPKFPWGSPGDIGGPQSLMTATSLFTDTAGSIQYLGWNTNITVIEDSKHINIHLYFSLAFWSFYSLLLTHFGIYFKVTWETDFLKNCIYSYLKDNCFTKFFMKKPNF